MAFKEATEYFKAQSEQNKPKLEELRNLIMEVIPDTEEVMSYGVPAYTVIPGGKMQERIMIAGFKHHVGLYPHPTTIEHFWDELAPYKKGKGSVQFPVTQPLPKELIRRMIEYRKSLLLE